MSAQLNIVTVVGARPQFIKAAAMSRVLRSQHTETLIHTGQHYDDDMSQVFFDELDIPSPDVSLNAGGGSHAEQTSRMMTGIEQVLQSCRPDVLLAYGDTNSTLAAALAASKLHIPVAHVEAGLRSFNRRMPEEVNRVVTDHLSAFLLCPSETAVNNLAREGISTGVCVVGDIMADALFFAASRLRNRTVLTQHKLAKRDYLLATIHRAENTNDHTRLSEILKAFSDIRTPVLFPIHPRTRNSLSAAGIAIPQNVIATKPLGYLDMVAAIQEAKCVLTDSGGLQKEAYWLSIPCVTLRDETEWVETVELGWNVLAGARCSAIVNALASFRLPSSHPDLYGGDGRVAERILDALSASLIRD
jgi:UDP-GlcNAc3NAcA epimerase